MRYLRVNDKFCKLVGYERDELRNMRTSDVNLNENVEQMVEARRQMVSAQVTGATMEKQLVRKDGSLVWVSMAVSLIRASDGTPRYFMAVIQDISESKRAAAALKESEEQFRQLAHRTACSSTTGSRRASLGRNAITGRSRSCSSTSIVSSTSTTRSVMRLAISC
jgi:PAS domain S-box-containing protein